MKLPSKILPLLPSLSSDQDGEVVAAARAIGRVLKANGQDWHDIVTVLEPHTAAPVDFTSREQRLKHVIQRLFKGKNMEIRDVAFVQQMNILYVNKCHITDDQMSELFRLDELYA